MKISELSQRSGVSPASIKFYIREGLLPRGRTRAPNQAEYDDTHVDRLILVRTLREVGGFSIDRIRLVVEALDAAEPSAPEGPLQMMNLLAEQIESAHQPPAGHDAIVARARGEVDRLVGQLGWSVAEASTAREELAQILATIRSAWIADFPAEALMPYAQSMERIAELEIPDVSKSDSGDALSPARRARRTGDARWAVLRVVLGERVIAALRRMAHENRIRALREEAATPADGAVAVAGAAVAGD